MQPIRLHRHMLEPRNRRLGRKRGWDIMTFGGVSYDGHEAIMFVSGDPYKLLDRACETLSCWFGECVSPRVHEWQTLINGSPETIEIIVCTLLNPLPASQTK